MNLRTVIANRLAFLAVLRGREFRTFYLGQVSSITGHQMMIAAQSWLVYSLSGSPLVLGVVGGVQAVPGLVLNLFAGALADRSSPRHIIFASQAASAVLTAILAVVIMTGRVEVWHITVVAFLLGATTSLDTPARFSIWPHLVERSQYMFASSLNQSVWNGTRIIAPAVAGFVIAALHGVTGDDLLGIGITFWVAVAGFLAMCWAIMAVNIPPIKRARGATIAHDILEGLRFTVQHRIFLVLLLMTFVNGFFGISYMWLMPVFAREYLNVEVQGYGLLLSASGIGGLMGTLGMASFGQYQDRSWLVIGSALLLGLGLAFFAITAALVHSVPLALVLVVVTSFFFSVNQVSTSTLLNLIVPDEYRGRVMGLRGATWSIAPLGSLLAGSLAAVTSTAFAVAVGGVAVAVFAVGAAVASPDIRRLQQLLAEHSSSGGPVRRGGQRGAHAE